MGSADRSETSTLESGCTPCPKVARAHVRAIALDADENDAVGNYVEMLRLRQSASLPVPSPCVTLSFQCTLYLELAGFMGGLPGRRSCDTCFRTRLVERDEPQL